MLTNPHAELPAFELRFVWLTRRGSSSAFPCDAQGRVDIARLSESGRKNYAFAQAMAGRDIAIPRIQANTSASTSARARARAVH